MPSSPPPLEASSPLRGADARRSQFTYRQLGLLASYSTTNPLRVVAHIDLDAFYAQCEMVRLGVSEGKPLAVQQWQGLIAINYPARESGIGRHCNVEEAKKLCPDLIAQHVATWREGDDKWAYRDDAAANIATDKVSLDPYRLQSRKILALIKDVLPPNLQKVEKASIDEVFLDVSAQVHALLLERFPELSSPPPYDDPTERLPLPSIVALDWKTDALVDLDEEQETLDPDWDDVCILIGSEIVRHVRACIREKLGYTCSAGIANNKLLSKLGSAFKKPNQQTVVRGRATDAFLGGFKVTKMRNLGGKLGEEVVAAFNTDSVKELWDIPLETMKAKLGNEAGPWVYNTIRGIDRSEVNSRTQIKSMLSAKSFRPTINTPDQAVKWLRIFVADIFARLVEEGVLENKRRPRTINLHHRQGGQMRSRQGPIPQGKALSEGVLFDLAKDLLGQIIAEGRVWPCANLSLSVGGFEEGVKGNMGIDAFLVKGNMGIDAFLVKGEAAETLRSSTPDGRSTSTGPEPPSKKRRTEEGGIQKFFTKKPSTSEDSSNEAERYLASTEADLPSHQSEAFQAASPAPSGQEQYIRDELQCARCNASFGDPEDLQNHRDWHLAKELQEEEERARAPPSVSRAPAPRNPPQKGSGAPKRGRGSNRLEQGQSRLRFG